MIKVFIESGVNAAKKYDKETTNEQDFIVEQRVGLSKKLSFSNVAQNSSVAPDVVAFYRNTAVKHQTETFCSITGGKYQRVLFIGLFSCFERLEALNVLVIAHIHE